MNIIDTHLIRRNDDIAPLARTNNRQTICTDFVRSKVIIISNEINSKTLCIFNYRLI